MSELTRLTTDLIDHEGQSLNVLLNAQAASLATKQRKLFEVPEDYGAVGDGIHDDAPAINSAVQALKAAGGGILWLQAKTYLCGSAIDLKGAYVDIRGSGQIATKLKASFIGQTLIDLYELSDTRLSPIVISDLTLDSNSNTANSLRLQYRHATNFKNVLFTGATNAAVYALNAWLNRYENCHFESSVFGCWLAGSNHRTKFEACSFQGCSNRLLVVANGFDGNSALLWDNCDFEFSNAQGMQLNCTDASFNGCYLGENLGAAVFEVYGGVINVNGGNAFYGFTASTNLAYMTGGVLTLNGVNVSGQSFASLGNMVNGTGGKFALKNSPCFVPTGGSVNFQGDLLANLETKQVFAPRLGIDYTEFGSNVSITTSVLGSARTVTATAVLASPPVFGMRANLINMQWRDGEKWAVVVTYASNVSLNVRVASAPLGSGTFIGTLPATGGVLMTAVLYGTTAVRTTATVFEFFRDGTVAAGHTFTIYDVSFGDSRALGKDFGGNFANLYKF